MRITALKVKHHVENEQTPNDSDILIASHIRWKLKLNDAIRNKTTLDVTVISRDDCCVLGKWLHGDDTLSQIGLMESYRECVERHVAFHLVAGKVAEVINAKKYDEAELLLRDGRSPFNRSSAEVIASIFKLENEVNPRVFTENPSVPKQCKVTTIKNFKNCLVKGLQYLHFDI